MTPRGELELWPVAGVCAAAPQSHDSPTAEAIALARRARLGPERGDFAAVSDVDVRYLPASRRVSGRVVA